MILPTLRIAEAHRGQVIAFRHPLAQLGMKGDADAVVDFVFLSLPSGAETGGGHADRERIAPDDETVARRGDMTCLRRHLE